MQTSQTKLSEREIAQAWAQITVKLWRKNLNRLKVGQHSSGDLYRSFQFKVIAGTGGNVDRIEFAFRYYGKFLDMGVGKGTRLGDRPVSRGSRKLDYFGLYHATHSGVNRASDSGVNHATDSGVNHATHFGANHATFFC